MEVLFFSDLFPIPSQGISFVESIKNKHPQKNYLVFVYFPIRENIISTFSSKVLDDRTSVVGASYGSGVFANDKFSTRDIGVGVIVYDKKALDIEIAEIPNLPENISKVSYVFMDLKRKSFEKRKLYFSAILLQDAFSVEGDSVIEKIRDAGAIMKLAGGMAGDSWNFKESKVIYNDHIVEKGMVIVGFYTNKTVGIGIGHGWEPISREFIVTGVDGNKLLSLDGKKALDVYTEELKRHGIYIDSKDPVKTLAKYELGVYSGLRRQFVIRAPLGIDENGAIILAGRVMEGSRVYIMKASKEMLIKGAVESVNMAKKELKREDVVGGLFFSCAARHINFGEEYLDEVKAISKEVKANTLGFNTYGEFIKSTGGFLTFNNTTLISMLF